MSDESSTKGNMASLLEKIINSASCEAPSYVIMNIRDFFLLKRGPRWKYPLPIPRQFSRLKKVRHVPLYRKLYENRVSKKRHTLDEQ